MLFSCNQDTFAKYLTALSRVVNSKPGLPILSNVLLETSNGKLIMSVTDLEISMSCWIGADIKIDGKITAPAKQVAEFISSVPADVIDISIEGTTLSINTSNNSAQFNTITPDDFPSIVSVDDADPLLKLSKDDILKAVNRVAFAAATSDVKPVITGIKIEIANDTIAFIGTDGICLSRQVIKLNERIDTPIEILVPAKTMQELAHIVQEFESENSNNLVSLHIIEDRNQVIFKYNGIDLISRLIDGKYPDYKQVIPTGYQTRAEFSKADIQNSLKVVNIIARSSLGNKIIMELNSKENSITLSAAQADVGSNKSSFVAAIEGESITVAFGSKYIGNLLSHLGNEEIVFETNSALSAGVYKIKGDETYLHMIMPMRL